VVAAVGEEVAVVAAVGEEVAVGAYSVVRVMSYHSSFSFAALCAAISTLRN